MNATQYDRELENFGQTYDRALNADISRIKAAIAGACESSVIGIGSGGSFTAASLLCNLHETYTGRVSRPSTPLEIICNPTLASVSPVFLVSAEGKNPDIIEALQRARMHSARPVHVITNRQKSPLTECAEKLTDVRMHVFELTEKDGYLATNSLLLDAALIARAYGELDHEEGSMPASIDELRLGEQQISDWLVYAEAFIEEVVRRGSIIVTFSPLLHPIAADLESKLAESALLHYQFSDLRSFAHGRHIWLAERPDDCAVIALIEPSLSKLWEGMRSLLPSSVPTITMPFGGAKPSDLLAGLVAQMRLVSEIAKRLGRDPGRPNVAQFGRDLHYIGVSDLIAAPSGTAEDGEQSKYEVLGARWPFLEHHGTMRRALESFREFLEEQTFRAIVFDYDGTLCSSQRADGPPHERIVAQLRTLIDSGVLVAIASGRGGSIQEQLRNCLPQSCWQKVYVGLYNAGHISDLATSPSDQRGTSEFLSHVTRIVRHLQELGVPIETIRTTHPFQVSVRFYPGINTDSNWFVIADALRHAGLDLSRVVKSKHSVDILANGVDKSHLVAHVVQQFKIDPYEILTVGDQGAWPGNDSSLLEHRFSLSVDVPSRRLDRGWKLAPAHKRDVDATIWYLDHVRFLDGGRFRMLLSGSPEDRDT
jgi:HAD superfamily hydrolase (TIGR01484 family)